jgi:hypothetical protein
LVLPVLRIFYSDCHIFLRACSGKYHILNNHGTFSHFY